MYDADTAHNYADGKSCASRSVGRYQTNEVIIRSRAAIASCNTRGKSAAIGCNSDDVTAILMDVDISVVDCHTHTHLSYDLMVLWKWATDNDTEFVGKG